MTCTGVLGHFANLKLAGDRLVRDAVLSLQPADAPQPSPSAMRTYFHAAPPSSAAPPRRRTRRAASRAPARVHALSDADLEAELAARRATRARERDRYARAMRSEKLSLLEGELARLRGEIARLDRAAPLGGGTPPTSRWESLPALGGARARGEGATTAVAAAAAAASSPSGAVGNETRGRGGGGEEGGGVGKGMEGGAAVGKGGPSGLAGPPGPPGPPPPLSMMLGAQGEGDDSVSIDPEKQRREKEERQKRREQKRKEREAAKRPLTLADIIRAAGPDPASRLKPSGSTALPGAESGDVPIDGNDGGSAGEALKMSDGDKETGTKDSPNDDPRVEVENEATEDKKEQKKGSVEDGDENDAQEKASAPEKMDAGEGKPDDAARKEEKSKSNGNVKDVRESVTTPDDNGVATSAGGVATAKTPSRKEPGGEADSSVSPEEVHIGANSDAGEAVTQNPTSAQKPGAKESKPNADVTGKKPLQPTQSKIGDSVAPSSADGNPEGEGHSTDKTGDTERAPREQSAADAASALAALTSILPQKKASFTAPAKKTSSRLSLAERRKRRKAPSENKEETADVKLSGKGDGTD